MAKRVMSRNAFAWGIQEIYNPAAGIIQRLYNEAFTRWYINTVRSTFVDFN